MLMLGVIVPVERMTRAAAVRWCSHVSQKGRYNPEKSLNFETIERKEEHKR